MMETCPECGLTVEVDDAWDAKHWGINHWAAFHEKDASDWRDKMQPFDADAERPFPGDPKMGNYRD